MKRSTYVTTPLPASVALTLLTGCRKTEMKRCVDSQGVVVDDSLCNAQPQANPAGGYYPYHWYYGGWGGYTRGSTAGGGSYVPLAGHSYSSSTTRGGFGSTFHGGDAGDHGAGE
jgi:hypothetical protein